MIARARRALRGISGVARDPGVVDALRAARHRTVRTSTRRMAIEAADGADATSSWSSPHGVRARRCAITSPVLDAILKDEPVSARALYLFPTKALSSDQAAELYAHDRGDGCGR